MAQVDFSNAKIESVGNKYDLLSRNDVELNLGSPLYASRGNANQISNNSTRTIIYTSLTKTSIVYAGIFTASGTEFYFATGSANRGWKVSNISFSSGDTYSFQVDIDLTVR